MNTPAITSVAAGAAPSALELSAPARARPRSGAFNAAAIRNAAPAEQAAAVAAQFEAILVRQLLGETMTKMLGGSQGGVAGSVYGDMLADTISQQLTAGQGMGLGRYFEQQLAPKGAAAAPALPPASAEKS